MAPPANRRTGYSRRAQYTTFFAYVAGVIGALIGAILLLASTADHSGYAGLRGLAADAAAPGARVAASGRSATGQFLDTVAGFFTSGAETARLRREVAVARVRQVEVAAIADQNRRLKAMLGLAGQDPRAVAVGWLIASSDASTRRFATISVGARHGVAVGMPVRTPLGLVGRVLEVGHTTARVLLLTDSQSVVPVRRAGDGLPAFATGRADGTMQLRLLTLGINPLKPGDGFVTSGSGGLYWPGTPIAVVTSLTHDGAIARVLSDPAASEFAEVQPVWNPVADASLPPATPPAPAKPASKPKPAKHHK